MDAATNPSALSPALAATSLQLLTSTPVAGFALQNGTPIILTWTAPNDGNPHRVLIVATLDVSVVEVGGLVQMRTLDPAGVVVFSQVFAAGQAVGGHNALVGAVVQPGQAASLNQTNALTSGASTIWADIWAL